MKKINYMLVPLGLLTIFEAGSWANVSAQTTTPIHLATAQHAVNKFTSRISLHDKLIGVSASAVMGNTDLLINQINKAKIISVSLPMNVNGFQTAIDGNLAYVPTQQGKTFVVNLQTHHVISSFHSTVGAQYVNISNPLHFLIITGKKSVTAYSLTTRKPQWQVPVGGNTLAIAGDYAYLSSNSMKITKVIDLKSGKIVTSIPVGMIEDSVYDPQMHTVWLANWGNGDMTVVNAKTNKIIKVIRKKEGGGYTMNDMNNMMMATSGYMQLAVGPHGKHVYAASFSSHIMVFNAVKNSFEKDIPTIQMAMLSGLAVDPSGQYAYTTVDNMNETIAVSLKSGKVVATYPGLASYRWTSL